MKSSAPLRSIDARLTASTLPGFPVTSRRSLRRAGIDRRAIARRTEDGRLVEIWTDTFLVGIDLSRASRELVRAAAVESVGPRAALDGRSALHRRGLWDRHDDTIQVVSNRAHAPIPSWQVSFHTARSFDADHVEGIPTRCASEALFAATVELTPHQLAYVIKRGQYAREFTLEALEAGLADHARRRWVTRVRRAIDLRLAGSAGTKSRTEDELLPRLTEAFGEPLVNVFGAAGIPDYEPDFCWPLRRWIVEVDGDHHLDPNERVKDLARDEQLRAAGWIVVRIPWREVWRDVDAVEAHVRRSFGP